MSDLCKVCGKRECYAQYKRCRECAQSSQNRNRRRQVKYARDLEEEIKELRAVIEQMSKAISFYSTNVKKNFEKSKGV